MSRFKEYLEMVLESENKSKLNIDETSLEVFIPKLIRMIKNIKNFFEISYKKGKFEYPLRITLLTKTGLNKIREKHKDERKIKISSDVETHKMYGFNIYIKDDIKPISIYMIREETKSGKDNTKSNYSTILYSYNQNKENTKPEMIENLSVRNPNESWEENEKEIRKLIGLEISNFMREQKDLENTSSQ